MSTTANLDPRDSPSYNSTPHSIPVTKNASTSSNKGSKLLRPRQYLSAIKSKDTSEDHKIFSTKHSSSLRIVELVDASVNSVVDLSIPLFQPFPEIISFKGYQPYETYETLITMRNNDKVIFQVISDMYIYVNIASHFDQSTSRLQEQSK